VEKVMGLKRDIGFKGYEDKLRQEDNNIEESDSKKSKLIIAGIIAVVSIVIILIIVLVIVPMVSDGTDSPNSSATTSSEGSKKKDYDLDYLFGPDDEETTTYEESGNESSQVPRMTIAPYTHSSSIPESSNESQSSESDSNSNSNSNSNGNDNSNNNSGNSQSHSVNNNSNNNNSYNNSNNNSSYHKPESSKKEESSRNTDIPVSGVTLNYTSTTLYEGDNISLVANISPSNATNKSVSWSSSNSSVATVRDGYVTAHSSGTAYITARAGSYYVNCFVTVKEKDNVKLSPDRKTISKNQIVTIKAEGTNDKVSWKISNPSVAQICGGSETSLMIKGKNTGTTYIEATVNGKTYKAEITVN
jgi:hypothetical protein